MRKNGQAAAAGVDRSAQTCVEFGNSDCVATSPQGALEQRQLVAVGTTGSFRCRLGQPPGSLQATLQTRFLALFVPSPAEAQTPSLMRWPYSAHVLHAMQQ